MRLLNDAQYQQFRFIIDRVLKLPCQGKRDSHSRYACALFGEGGKDESQAYFEAGYAHAMDIMSNMIHQFYVEAEEYLSPYDDDEADIYEYAEEDEPCDD